MINSKKTEQLKVGLLVLLFLKLMIIRRLKIILKFIILTKKTKIILLFKINNRIKNINFTVVNYQMLPKTQII